MMNKELKARWVKALRSGEYEQGKGLLNSDGKFCCLGVLCEITYQELGFEKSRVQNMEGVAAYYCYDAQALVPSKAMTEILFGMGDMPVLTINGRTNSIWQHNDTRGHSFEEIADAIEEQL